MRPNHSVAVTLMWCSGPSHVISSGWAARSPLWRDDWAAAVSCAVFLGHRKLLGAMCEIIFEFCSIGFDIPGTCQWQDKVKRFHQHNTKLHASPPSITCLSFFSCSSRCHLISFGQLVSESWIQALCRLHVQNQWGFRKLIPFILGINLCVVWMWPVL